MSSEASTADRLPITIQLGRTHLAADQLARVEGGTQLVLDQSVDAPLDVYANDHLIARGEIVLVDEKFCLQITELVTHVNEVA